ncbi:MAG: formylglycine-generating enzyme family protein, partial [Verrucomicrobia bacterium]|nr:formylglycine-generating enzyme family protein [Verrucomicrobiota bacterium]
YDGNSDEMTHPVGQKKPNDWGLYDMHGNVWEWCLDWNGDYPETAVVDPTGPDTGEKRIIRGGSCGSIANGCRSAYRSSYYPGNRDGYHGFRVALTPVQ